MIKAPRQLVEDFKNLLSKYDIYIDVGDEYDGQDEYCGIFIEIKSKAFIGDSLPIYIDDIKEFARLINT